MASGGTRYTEEQIIRIVKECESGASVSEVCRKFGVSEQTVYRWRNKYRGVDTSELQRLRELEAENRRLKHSVAQQVRLRMAPASLLHYMHTGGIRRPSSI